MKRVYLDVVRCRDGEAVNALSYPADARGAEQAANYWGDIHEVAALETQRRGEPFGVSVRVVTL